MAFSETRLWQKLKKYSTKMGTKALYTVLLLFFAYKREDTPVWAKNIVLGALAYFISPIDLVPDLSPFIGFTDDIGVLSYGLVTIACYVNGEVREKAREKLHKWFAEPDTGVLDEVDKHL